MKDRIPKHLFFIVLLTSFAVFSGPIKTVPWNGHKGAVSFTFDDGIANQVTNVAPALKSRGIHATFYLIGDWNSNSPSPWIQVSRDGNEIGNHTRSWAGLTDMSDSLVREAVVDEAVYSRNQDTSIECVTLAYPGCGRNENVDAIVNTENFIARTCSFGGSILFDWNTKPDNWMDICGLYIDNANDLATAATSIDDAAQNNTWFVALTHGVGDDANIKTDDVTAMFDRAINDNLWIETYQNVGAYWRASLTIDTARAVSNGSGWDLTWTSPHPRMPKSVPLLVTLDKSIFGSDFCVCQNDKEISPLADGSYPIEFMNMQLTVSTTCSQTVITPYLQIDSGTWQKTSSAALNAGQTIKFGPQPTSDGSWSWSGPNGFSASTREVTISKISSSQAGDYIATYTNTSGSKSNMTFTVAICTKEDLTPYLRINDGIWEVDSSATINAGQTIILGPQPITGGSWSWSGPNGFRDSTREITISNFSTSKAGSYVATYTESTGCTSVITFTISMSGNTSVDGPHSRFGIKKAYAIENTHRGLFLKIQGFDEKAAVTIYNLKGVSVYRNICSKNKIYIPGLNKGVYLIKIVQGNSQLNGNFIVR